jgi:hypothetical protein
MKKKKKKKCSKSSILWINFMKKIYIDTTFYFKSILPVRKRVLLVELNFLQPFILGMYSEIL